MCKAIREGDEIACSCGLRWGIGEDDPHSVCEKEIPHPLKCRCEQGFASKHDGLCKFCREVKYTRAKAKSVNVRHRGDGMSIDQEAVLLGTKKRSEVYI